MRNPLSTLADALRAEQNPETVSRNGTSSYTPGTVDTVSAPSDLVEEYNLYQETGLIAAALEQFASDVTACGYRVTAESDATEDFFNGGDAAPSETPQDGFLAQAGIVGGQRHQDFGGILRQDVLSYMAAGNLLDENVKDEDDRITGFLPIHPGSVKIVTEENKPILVDPERTIDRGTPSTERGEAAAFLQYHAGSIYGQKGRYTDRGTIPLSQNDVTFQPRNPRPGDIWGVPVTRSVKQETTELKQVVRDNAEAIQRKAYGIWSVAFETDVTETGQETIVTEWSTQDQKDFLQDKIGKEMGPGDIIGHDGSVSFEKFEGEVAEGLLDVINTYVQLIVARLPTPLYAVGFESNINQFVVQRQETRYEDGEVADMRDVLERTWTPTLRLVAEQWDLDPAGLKLRVEPNEDESPIRSLSTGDIEKISTYADAMETLLGPEPATKINREDFADLIAQVPEDAFSEGVFGDEEDPDETDSEEEQGVPPEDSLPDPEEIPDLMNTPVESGEETPTPPQQDGDTSEEEEASA